MPTAPKRIAITPKHAAPARVAPRTTTERGYGWKHQKARAKALRENPLCQRCGEDWSAHLHHIDRNPHNRAPANLEMLCKRCHAAEHDGSNAAT